ncbi:hypothetical protein [Halovivax sp.]|uniref:hypothetical protein n=1 Tax=Halovivax sp. TaxID=1935978 RepID=UPI0025C5D8D0|nr:hypothetical protein [Halovivax sp.]
MVERTLAGVFGVLSVVALIALGAYGFVDGYVLDVPGDARPAASFVTLIVAAAFVAGLSAIGARGGRGLRTPYW